MKIGMRAHDIDCTDMESLCSRLAELDIHTIQLALLKSIGNIPLTDGCFSFGLAGEIQRPLQQHRIRVSVLGCYIDPICGDGAQRRVQLNRFQEHMKFAKYLGAGMIGTETGCVKPGEEAAAYAILLESMKELVSAAEKLGVMIGVEPVRGHTLSSPQKMADFLKDVPSPNLSVIFDLNNLLDEDNFRGQREVIDESFALFGDRIAAIHIKDFKVESGKKIPALPGEGIMDIPYLFSVLKEKKPYIDILTEEIKEKDIVQVKQYLERI